MQRHTNVRLVHCKQECARKWNDDSHPVPIQWPWICIQKVSSDLLQRPVFFFVFVETKVVRDCRLSSRAFWPASVVIAQILLFNCYELTWLGQIRQSNLDLEWKEEHKNKCPNVKIKRTPSNFFGIESLKLYLLSMTLASSSFIISFLKKRKR